MRDAGPHRPTDWFFCLRFAFSLSGEVTWEQSDENADDREQRCRNGNEIGRPHISNEILGDVSAEDRAKRSTDSDEAIEPFALFNGEEVRHKRPEDRGVEQIENADPNVKRTAGPNLLDG